METGWLSVVLETNVQDARRSEVLLTVAVVDLISMSLGRGGGVSEDMRSGE